jgi:hypothetical protein
MLACLFVDHMKAKQQEYDKYIINNMKSESFKQEIDKVLASFVDSVRHLEPCNAVYPGETEREIVCTTERMCHG